MWAAAPVCAIEPEVAVGQQDQLCGRRRCSGGVLPSAI